MEKIQQCMNTVNVSNNTGWAKSSCESTDRSPTTSISAKCIMCGNQFYYRATACNATHGIAVGILSVCLSVRQMRVL